MEAISLLLIWIGGFMVGVSVGIKLSTKYKGD